MIFISPWAPFRQAAPIQDPTPFPATPLSLDRKTTGILRTCRSSVSSELLFSFYISHKSKRKICTRNLFIFPCLWPVGCYSVSALFIKIAAVEAAWQQITDCVSNVGAVWLDRKDNSLQSELQKHRQKMRRMKRRRRRSKG